MKAMILAAGLGTRLLPLTNKMPKPLFPLANRPLIDILIGRLQAVGCEAVMINTHHLGHMIDTFVQNQSYRIPVRTTYEPTLLETGGAIKNVRQFWDDRPFMVINGDIFTNIDLKQAYAHHFTHGHPVTMVLHDCEPFNNVWVDGSDHIRGFGISRPCPPPGASRPDNDPTPVESSGLRCLAFTGVQIIDPRVLEAIPPETPCSIIDIYCRILDQGAVLQGFLSKNHYWHDIGTKEGYREAAKEALARKALNDVSPGAGERPLFWTTLKGDGSNRIWQRVASGASDASSVVFVDHGLPPIEGGCEADSFAAIGNHLHKRNIPVPKILGYERPFGWVALEDLGDMHLQEAVVASKSPADTRKHYTRVIDVLVSMGIDGATGFEPSFTYQTRAYDRDLILEKEAKYFCDAFLMGFKGTDAGFDQIKVEFEVLATRALDTKQYGFLHRDFQSRNILLSKGGYYVIDFQGGRLGPLQYDLASLLIDPYTALPEGLQEDLLGYYLERLSKRMPVDPAGFIHAYRYCAVNRNLQILGAFAFLGQVKGKRAFLEYIPAAVRSLKKNIRKIDPACCRRLGEIIETL
jgi:NDP-sugar pyrophosphorylase family protein